MLQPQAEAKGLDFQLHLPSEAIGLVTDGHKLKHILLNLVGNAVKFTAQGHVHLRLAWLDRARGTVQFQVEDSGIGIAADKLSRIFEAFGQADDSIGREHGGTGLGLSIAEEFAKHLGGRILVESTEGEGSCFTLELNPHARIEAPTVTLPVTPPPLEAVNSPERGAALASPAGTLAAADSVTDHSVVEMGSSGGIAAEGAPGMEEEDTEVRIRETLCRVLRVKQGQRVVVLDDLAESRGHLTRYLADCGVDCRECASPEALWRLVDEFSPHLIVLDVVMPEVNGWEVLMQLKEDRSTAEIEVAFISVEPTRGEVFALGTIDALRKPIERKEFIASVRRNLHADEIRHRSVLIVDDFVEFHDIMKAWIGEETNDIRAAAHGKEALSILEDFIPEIIFLDIMMPVMDGFTFLQLLRSQERLAHIPVIVITGKTLTQDELAFLQSRASSALQSPAS
jgi:CheY-like chemotaxis protein